MLDPANEITALILAGGRGSRMGGEDKGLVTVDGRPLIDHLLYHVTRQVTSIVISANRHLELYRAYGYPVMVDEGEKFRGPLIGIASALPAVTTSEVWIVPCDALTLPADLCRRLALQRRERGKPLAVVHDGERLQPLHCLFQRTLSSHLAQFIEQGGRSVYGWINSLEYTEVDYRGRTEEFNNINSL
ncbi:MAG: molybdopterin-guanine dinucleotide biosynthesis protein A [Halothiobacillaceae bacterium]|nr:MAG: molybdopterin-guanine dinucleotide biosynthesis protein A [Halothiobacillaceae bacterium]